MSNWTRPTSPPPPLFLGQKERDLVKSVNDEIAERIIGKAVVYYAIDIDSSNFHPVYGESLSKTFLSPIRIYALIHYDGEETTTTNYGSEKRSKITIYFHKRRLTEDQNIFVRVGDFVNYSDSYYEILSIEENRELFGQQDHRFEIEAKCIKSRKNLFDAS